MSVTDRITEQVLFLLVISAGLANAFFPELEAKCNATQDPSQCSVTLGGTVFIQLMTNSSGFQLQCKKQLPSGTANVFRVKREYTVFQEDLKNRTEFFINNGTFKISHVQRTDSAQYLVEVFDPDGRRIQTLHVQLNVRENNLHLMIIVCAVVAALLIMVVVICCACRKCRSSGTTNKI